MPFVPPYYEASTRRPDTPALAKHGSRLTGVGPMQQQRLVRYAAAVDMSRGTDVTVSFADRCKDGEGRKRLVPSVGWVESAKTHHFSTPPFMVGLHRPEPV
jgi:hypothetical protein